MAIVTRYISAGSTAGGDGTTTALVGDNRAYASIGEWVNARVAANPDFVAAGVIEKGVCLPDAPFLERPNLTGATTGVDNYWWLTASVRNNGTAGAGVVIDNENTILATNAGILTLTNNYSQVDSIEIKNLRTTNDSNGYFVKIVGTGVSTEGLLIHDCTVATTQRPNGIGTTNSSTSANLIVRNCIIYDLVGVFNPYGINFGDAGGCIAQNNTVINMRAGSGTVALGIRAGSRITNTSQNNLILNCTGGSTTNNCFNGTWATETNDVSTDTTAAGTGSITSVTAANEVVSATEGSVNGHLKAGAQSINAGATLTLATDISNNVRPQGASWDIGADEFIAAATAAVTRIMRLFEGFKIKFVSGRVILHQKQ